MSVPMSDLVAAPIQHTINGIEYFFSPLTLYDWGIFDRWLRSQVAEIANLTNDETLKKSLPLISITNSDVEGLGQTIQSLMSTPEGICKILMLSVNKKHPEATVEDIESVLSPTVGLPLVQQVLEASGLGTSSKQTQKAKRTAKAKKR